MTDDSDAKNAIRLRLAQHGLYQRLRDIYPDAIPLIDDAVYYSCQRAKLIVKIMPQFTLHDEDHLFQVLLLMEKLIPANVIERLHAPEIMLLILAAFFHDLGMAPSIGDIDEWTKIWEDALNGVASSPTTEFAIFLAGYPGKIKTAAQLVKAKAISKAEAIRAATITDFVRTTHAKRAKEVLATDWADRIKFGNIDLTGYLGRICESHYRPINDLLDLDEEFLCAPGCYACFRLVAVALRLADILDFDAKRSPEAIFMNAGITNRTSIVEWKKHRDINTWDISPQKIAYSATCKEPLIEAAVREFCAYINAELRDCAAIIEKLPERVKARWPFELPIAVDQRDIRTALDARGKPLYRYIDCRLTMSQSDVVELLMGTNLYGERGVAIRELVQNSLDACFSRLAIDNSDSGSAPAASITVEFKTTPEGDSLRVEDNGTGMDDEIITQFYAKIASSYYRSPLFHRRQSQFGMTFHPISRFGIGRLACFMVAESIELETRHLNHARELGPPIRLRIDGVDGVFGFFEGTRTSQGTSTVLRLKEDHPWSKMNDDARIGVVKNTLINPPFPVTIRSNAKEIVHDGSEFLNGPLVGWTNLSEVRTFVVQLNEPSVGIVGKAMVALLESDGKPVAEKIAEPTVVEIEGQRFELRSRYFHDPGTLFCNSDTIGRSDGKLVKHNNSSAILNSLSRLAVHGISVPTGLFPNSGDGTNQLVRLKFPFLVNLRLDVIGHRDLDLNAARTHVIQAEGEKWLSFTEALSYALCKGVRQQVPSDYWKQLEELWTKTGKEKAFLDGLARAGC